MAVAPMKCCVTTWEEFIAKINVILLHPPLEKGDDYPSLWYHFPAVRQAKGGGEGFIDSGD
jgi:hypothetical protein